MRGTRPGAVADPHALERAFDIARQDTPAGISPDEAVAEIQRGAGLDWRHLPGMPSGIIGTARDRFSAGGASPPVCEYCRQCGAQIEAGRLFEASLGHHFGAERYAAAADGDVPPLASCRACGFGTYVMSQDENSCAYCEDGLEECEICSKSNNAWDFRRSKGRASRRHSIPSAADGRIWGTAASTYAKNCSKMRSNSP